MSRTYFEVLIAVGLALSGCRAVVDWIPPTEQPLAQGDFVAIGRLKNHQSEPIDPDPDDLIGHGWFNAEFHVSRNEIGRLPSKVVRVRYFAHTWLREDTEFRFRLRPSGNGDYIICKRPGASGYRCD